MNELVESKQQLRLVCLEETISVNANQKRSSVRKGSVHESFELFLPFFPPSSFPVYVCVA